MRWLFLVATGFCMGAADLVPGISGGTMAFMLGIYNELINSIKKIRWRFLLPLGIGMVMAGVLLGKILGSWLNSPESRCYLYAVFLGLVAASAVVCVRRMKVFLSRHWIMLLAGVVIAVIVTDTTTRASVTGYNVPISVPSYDKTISNYDGQMLLEVSESTVGAMIAKKVIDPNTRIFSHGAGQYGNASTFVRSQSGWLDWSLVGCGVLAISAMLLPGISGSYILLMFDKYGLVLGAMVDFIDSIGSAGFNVEAFSVLASFAIGVFGGALLFARFISFLFSRYSDATLAVLVGLMVGALKAVWPFWSYTYTLQPLHLGKGPQLKLLEPIMPDMALPQFWIAMSAAVAGFAVIMAMSAAERRRQRRV